MAIERIEIEGLGLSYVGEAEIMLPSVGARRQRFRGQTREDILGQITKWLADTVAAFAPPKPADPPPAPPRSKPALVKGAK